METQQGYTVGFGDKGSDSFPLPNSAPEKRGQTPVSRFPETGTPIQAKNIPLNPASEAATPSASASEPLGQSPSARQEQIFRQAQKLFPNDPVAADLLTTQVLHEAHPHRETISALASKKNNLLGIKGKNGYAAFPTWQASMEAYVGIVNRNFPRALKQKTFENAAWGLQHGSGGRRYAADPRYTHKIRKVYVRHVRPMRERRAREDGISPYAISEEHLPQPKNTAKKGQYHILKGTKPNPEAADQLVANQWGADYPVTRMPRLQAARAEAGESSSNPNPNPNPNPRAKTRPASGPDAVH